ncbi:MAG: AAA family ATPase [Candidatus Halichondribacter symbioticus]
MSKDNVLEYPKLDNEVITVKNFMVIKEATMKCGDITVLVGEQATGKSLLAKLRYFFWEYQQNLVSLGSFLSEEIQGFRNIKEYNEDTIKIFCELFSNIETSEDKFAISFENGDFVISVEKDGKGSEIRIVHSESVKDMIKRAKEIYNDINIASDKEFSFQKKLEGGEPDLIIIKYGLLIKYFDFFETPSVLYVPASRLFFATTVQENIFRLLDSGNYSLDFLLKRFSSFWEGHKESFSNKFKNPKRDKEWFDKAHEILAGDYVYENKIDYIENNWGGKAKLSNASSGQQEVLPLLAAIYAFPKGIRKNQLLIIEEPEAHIYPTSQRALIKMIADVVRKEKCKVMLTTHSPYIPACINNEIKIADNADDLLGVTSYHVSNRTVEDIYYKKYDLINVKKLDEASTQIAKEYCEQVAIEKKRQNKTDKSHG